MDIILASGSPRRYDLLKQMGWNVEVHSLPFAEAETVNEAAEHDLVLLSPYRNADLICAYNALGKGKAAAEVLGTAVPVIAADTIVVLGETILGKPEDAADAKRMLRELSGRVHEVKTGTAVLYQDKTVLKVVTTKVFFRRLTEKEIDWYVQTGEPLDKAGAYGIQGKGAVLVEKIEGSYDNVVGLPLTEVYKILKDQLFCNL
jgi:septum formation protein